MKTKILPGLQKRARLGLPLNLPLTLHDGRTLIVRKGDNSTMRVRHRWDGKGQRPRPLAVGERVFTALDNGRFAAIIVQKLKGKDIILKIIGSVDEPSYV